MATSTNNVQKLIRKYQREKKALWKSWKAGMIDKQEYFARLRKLDVKYNGYLENVVD